MSIEDFYKRLVGKWEGDYSLWLRPDMAAEESKTKAKVWPTVKGAYYLLSYCWIQGGKDQEGLFFLGGKGDKAITSWGDSFHSVPEPLHCKGRLGNGKLIFDATYSSGPDTPEWGWRTEFTLQDVDGFLMEAYNITPDGQEALAVRAEMKRAGGG